MGGLGYIHPDGGLHPKDIRSILPHSIKVPFNNIFGFMVPEIIQPLYVRGFIPKHTLPIYSDFVKVYRVIIDYVNPIFKHKLELNYTDKNNGIPILLIDPNNNRHIETYYDFTTWEKFFSGFLLSGSEMSDAGYKWIVNTAGTVLDWTTRNKDGSNHGRGMGNVYGRKLIIEPLTASHFRQTYEFVGALNEHHDELDIGLLLPIYENEDAKLTPIIKNIIFSCDTLTTNNADEFFLMNEKKTALVITEMQER